MRKRNGRPTLGDLGWLCHKYGLHIFRPDMYTRMGYINWGSGKSNEAAAQVVADAIRAEGYEVELRHYDQSTGRTGQLTIKAKP